MQKWSSVLIRLRPEKRPKTASYIDSSTSLSQDQDPRSQNSLNLEVSKGLEVSVITHYGEDHDSDYGLDPTECRSGFFFLKKLRAHSTRVTSLAFSNTLHVLVSAKANNKIFLWSVEEWENLKGRHLLMPAGRNPEVPCDTHIRFTHNR
ncbi:hypothetical protein K1719_046980 [Acacia pycnantha]|nr:hypothetical protein K1719_046980 [Acacia pycnantha]